MGRILAVPLLLVLALAHDIDQRTQLLPVLLLLCFELLDILQDLVSVSSDETEYALDTIRSKTYLFMDHYMINYLLSTSAFDT